MDTNTQQIVMREGDPSRPKNTDVKADTTGSTSTVGEDTGKTTAKSSESKKGKTTKKHTGAHKSKKHKGKKVKSTTGVSSDSSKNGTDSSDSSSDDTEPQLANLPKHATKKPIHAHKVKSQTKKRSSPSKLPLDTDSSTDSSDSEPKIDENEKEKKRGAKLDNGDSANTDKKASMVSVSSQIAKEIVGHVVQLAQAQSFPQGQVGYASQVPIGYQNQSGNAPPFNYPTGNQLGAQYAAGVGAGLGSSLSTSNLPAFSYSAGAQQLSAFQNPALTAGAARPIRTQPSSAVGGGANSASGATGEANADKKSSATQKQAKSKKLDYKRVDQVWDNTIHNFKLQETAHSASETKYDGFCFHVRRTFDWEGKYKVTVIDIKSKLLREGLQDVIGNIKGVSLVDETPKLDPNVLFLYLEDLRKYAKALKKEVANPPGADKQERKKEAKRVEEKRQHLKVLVKYIDKDYEHIKKSLYPMLEHGLITFDLLWALWKPDTLAYSSTYGSREEPRVFKVDTAEKHASLTRGEYYYIDGRYFEYDGKQFGYGNHVEEIPEFRGAKKITSLNTYPLKYHKNEEKLRKELIERGRKFVALGGVHYKNHHGMAYFKKKKAIVKVNVNGRVMVDSAIHRRINPNYPVSNVRPKEHDIISDGEDSDEDSDDECGSDDEADGLENGLEEVEDKIKYINRIVKDDRGRLQVVRMTKEEFEEMNKEKLSKVDSQDDADAVNSDDEEGDGKSPGTKKVPAFTDEEYLIASPVVLGFSFGEKLWLEFTVSGIKDISWNESAYESLVLEPKTKETVKALVESHKYHAAESIDDVIQGKGKGLVAVLHGPPGTGKTLTAEGISELLKCPLYMVSAGELGTDSRLLEGELQRILDICHAWGAILLLDEADVFLEKRNMHDIHRNALVSIFLRQLEYFQGILFLTTNRVETFDDAFQSRIHIALRYDPLDLRAKKAIFKMFVDRARAQQLKRDVEDKKSSAQIVFTDEDYDNLARHDLNGRQIKNTVIRAQALAVSKGELLGMAHVRQILDVQVNFDRDLKGGTGYQDAMRSYF